VLQAAPLPLCFSLFVVIRICVENAHKCTGSGWVCHLCFKFIIIIIIIIILNMKKFFVANVKFSFSMTHPFGASTAFVKGNTEASGVF
jgi:hypothetical protein